MNGTLVFNQDRLEVEHLAGRVGGGQVNFSGYITYGDTIGFDLTTNGTDIRFRYGGISVTADQNLRLNGTLQELDPERRNHRHALCADSVDGRRSGVCQPRPWKCRIRRLR